MELGEIFDRHWERIWRAAYAVAGDRELEPKVIVRPARLNAGPGFLPAQGWTTTASERTATAVSANSPS